MARQMVREIFRESTEDCGLISEARREDEHVFAAVFLRERRRRIAWQRSVL